MVGTRVESRPSRPSSKLVLIIRRRALFRFQISHSSTTLANIVTACLMAARHSGYLCGFSGLPVWYYKFHRDRRVHREAEYGKHLVRDKQHILMWKILASLLRRHLPWCWVASVLAMIDGGHRSFLIGDNIFWISLSCIANRKFAPIRSGPLQMADF